MIECSEDIVGIVEYGATARGDADTYSDFDVCAILDDVDEITMTRLRNEVAWAYSADPRSVSCYRLATLDKMVQGGSLFLWHLRLEGRVLSDRDGIVVAALQSLAPYTHYRRDVERFKGIFDDVIDEFKHATELSAFELHVLCVVARNLCMLLTVRAGHPSFGRGTVYAAALAAQPRLPMGEAVWRALVMGHLMFMRNVPRQSAVTSPNPHEILDQVGELVEFSATILC